MSQLLTSTEEIILASGSPRRKDYLTALGLSFRVVPASIEEKCSIGEKPSAYVERLAREKALCVAQEYPEYWIVAADTVVCLEDTLLEKPGNSEEALEMLMALSGREHIVRTALCLHNSTRLVTRLCSVNTRVVFWNFTVEMARSYVESGESMDKAGGYGIQGDGAFLVREIYGSYSNVVGLPLCEFIEMLSECQLIRNE